MPGMNSGVNVNDPTVIAAFQAALHPSGDHRAADFRAARAGLDHGPGVAPGRRGGAPRPRRPRPVGTGPAGRRGPAEPAWRQVLRVGFGLLWVFDGILQAQPKMAIGLPSQVIQPAAASSPRWVQQVVNWAGTTWSYHPMQAGAAAVWIQIGIGIWLLAAARGLVPAGRWPAWAGAWWSGCSGSPSAGSSPPA